MEKRGHLLPSGNLVLLCISSYSKTPSRRIIYALFLQSVIGFWELRPQTSTGTPLGDFRLQTPNLLTPGKKILPAPVNICMWFVRTVSCTCSALLAAFNKNEL